MLRPPPRDERGAIGVPPAAGGGALTGCPANPAAGASHVDVRTATKQPGGGTALPPVHPRPPTGIVPSTGSLSSTRLGAAPIRLSG